MAKRIVATGVSSGVGFEAMRQLLESPEPYRIIFGARNTGAAQAAYDALSYDRSQNSVTVLPLELNNTRQIKPFVSDVLSKLGGEKLDYVFLCAGITNDAKSPGPYGSQWSEALIVNHLSHHYMMHLLREKIVESQSRVIFVSSGAIRRIQDPSPLYEQVKAGSGADGAVTYPNTKYIALLNAHWWRRQLKDQARVLAVSPGLVPGTGIGRGSGFKLDFSMADAQPPSKGGESLVRAFTREDFPEDPDQIFLTSWGEWWPKETIGNTLDKDLQDKWSWSKEEVEKMEGLTE